MDDRVAQDGRRAGGAVQVFDALRGDIIALRLTPGAILSRADIQERFGLSSTPVRDALMRLQEEGLVDVYPQYATVVAPIDLSRAREAQFLRRSVEMELARGLALRRDAALIERLRSLIRQQSALADEGEYEAFTTADHAFHQTMYDALAMGALWGLVRRRGGHIDRLRRLHLPVAGKLRDILAQHAAIVDAIAAGDPVAAPEMVRLHLSKSLDFVEQLRETHPAYFRD